MAGVGAIVLVTNALPDYVSLFETRCAIGWAARLRSLGQVLVLDAVLTATISMVAVLLVLNAMMEPNTNPLELGIDMFVPRESRNAVAAALGVSLHPVSNSAMRVFFLSAFFTSAWFWLYALSVLVSRVLLRMNSGVGFLLRVTDVERQPFRSIGFVSVIVVSAIVVSAIFVLGLPLVVL